MLRPVLKWLGRRYQKHLGVETPYFEDVVEHAPGALLPIFGFTLAATGGRHLPTRVLHMVKLGATLAQDCGTCLEIERNLAVRDGVPPTLIDAAVGGRTEALESDAAVALRFGERLARGFDVADERATLKERFGPRGVIEASVAAASAMTFPVVQKGMGHGRPCGVEPPWARSPA